MSRAAVSSRAHVTIRAAVLTDDESKRYFGTSLADYGVQAVWLSVNNASDLLLRFLPIVTDPNYFTARGSRTATSRLVVGQCQCAI